jgi:hypothetical protein
VGFDPDGATKHGSRLVQILYELCAHGEGCFDTLPNLLKITFAGPAALESRLHIR